MVIKLEVRFEVVGKIESSGARKLGSFGGSEGSPL